MNMSRYKKDPLMKITTTMFFSLGAEHILVLLGSALTVQAWIVSFPNDERSNIDSNEIDIEGEPDRLKLIFPGTKWCGSGNSAISYNDLGKQKATDACCREHDHCPDVIEAGKTAHGLSNPSVYTRLHCDCDKKFLNCLRKSAITEKTSNIVGLLYFDALHTQCYQEDYPVIGCVKYSKVPRRCQEYSFNRTANRKEWQWLDVPLF